MAERFNTIRVRLTNPSGATLGVALAQVRIEDTDPLPVINLEGINPLHEGPDSEATLKVHLDYLTEYSVTIIVQTLEFTTPDAAVPSHDYVHLSRQYNIPPKRGPMNFPIHYRF